MLEQKGRHLYASHVKFLTKARLAPEVCFKGGAPASSCLYTSASEEHRAIYTQKSLYLETTEGR